MNGRRKMKHLRLLPSSVVLALTLGAFNVNAQVNDFQPVTDEVLRNPSDADWLQWRRTYDGWAYSPLDQINRENVGDLRLVWSRALNAGGVELIPLVHDGVMYIPNPGGVIEAVDATTGDLIWQYRREPPETTGRFGGGGTTRNIAMYDDKIFFAAPADGFLIALDARTGAVVWETEITRPEDRARHSAGPIVVRGKVLTGRACSVGGHPEGCFIAAHDAETGEELWRRHTAARPGEPGGDTWGGVPLEERQHVSVWMPGTYDPELDLVYWGTGVPGPYTAIARGFGGEYQGDLLYSNSTLALNSETGEIVWYYQHLPGDDLDMDHVHERILVDTTFEPSDELEWYNPAVADEERKVLWAAGKMGIQFVLDRETGEFLWARPMLHQNVVLDIDDTGRVTKDADLIHREFGDVLVAGPRAGKDWWYGAYSPLTNAVYQPLLNAWVRQTSLEFTGTGNAASRQTISSPDQTNLAGMVKGYNVATGELLWEHKQAAPWLGGLVSTGGGLLFGGDINRRFRALDQETGEVLWESILNSRVTGGAISYGVDGRQYIAVASGGNTNGSYERFDLTPDVQLEAPTGSNTMWVFALPESE